jgi:hypothetical protein
MIISKGLRSQNPVGCMVGVASAGMDVTRFQRTQSWELNLSIRSVCELDDNSVLAQAIAILPVRGEFTDACDFSNFMIDDTLVPERDPPAKPIASITRWVAIRMSQRRIGYASSSSFTRWSASRRKSEKMMRPPASITVNQGVPRVR